MKKSLGVLIFPVLFALGFGGEISGERDALADLGQLSGDLVA